MADWLTLGSEERGGSLRVGRGGRLLERSSLGWKLPTAYTPCVTQQYDNKLFVPHFLENSDFINAIE